MEARAATERDLRHDRTGRLPAWLLGLVPLLLIVAAIGPFARSAAPGWASGAARRPRSSRSRRRCCGRARSS